MNTIKLRNPCCKNCEDRVIGCHSSCFKYAEYRRQLDNLNTQRENEKLGRLYHDYDPSRFRVHHTKKKVNE